jgi:hypothetical protein
MGTSMLLVSGARPAGVDMIDEQDGVSVILRVARNFLH